MLPESVCRSGIMKLETIKHCLWDNRYAPEPVLAGTVAFGESYPWTTQQLPQRAIDVLDDVLPGALPGRRVVDAPALVAHIAQALQLLADVPASNCGVATREKAERRATVFFGCRDFTLGTQALSLAVQVTARIIRPDITPERIARMLESCGDAAGRVGFEGPTLEIIHAAIRRDIPWLRLSPLVRHVQLGQGHRQQRLWNTLFSNESGLARDYARNKSLALNLLAQLNLPVGHIAAVSDIADARRSAREIGYPLVLKPVQGRQGESVYVGLRDDDELTAASTAARINERPHLLQSFFPGDDHRMLVIDGRLVAAVRRDPAAVRGDGRRTVAELVERENRDRRRVAGSGLKPIKLTEDSDRILVRQGSSRGAVPEKGRIVRVIGTANTATGGTVTDVLATVHPDNERLAVRAGKAIGLRVAGVDFICPDISKSWREVGGGICEVNTTVGLHPELRPGPGITVPDLLVATMFPRGDDGRIPTAMVTGTTGKTSTSTMLASILSAAGHVVGCATTEGVRIDTEIVAHGDLASADGAALVLRDPMVTAAVLETARGGIVKTGIYLDRCDVGALLNIQRDQIDMDGIETLDDMVSVKRKVLDSARKAVVLNADDPRCLALAPEFHRVLRTILFSRDRNSAALQEHAARGGDVLFLDTANGPETIVLRSGSGEIPLVGTAEVPATKGGLIWFHGTNAMAAAALAMGLGVGLESIRDGLRRYGAEYPAAAFRAVFAGGFPMQVLLDSSGKPPAYAAAVTVIDAAKVKGKRFCVITLPGNRPEWAFAETAAAVAGHFDGYVCFEREDYRRGRQPGEIASRLAEALLGAGVNAAAIRTAGGHKDAAQLLARELTPEDFVAIFGIDCSATVEDYRIAFRAITSNV
jgi:cyanophycin synthetase